MAGLRTVAGCTLLLTEATLYMLDKLRRLAEPIAIDAVEITAGTNGVHSGPDDPHYRGDALDIRTHTLPTRAARFALADDLMASCGKLFYAFVEDPDGPNEHVHVQVAKGCVYPPVAIRVPVPRDV